MSTTHLTAGFLPLLDSVLLVLAREKGFAEDEGLDLHLVRETSWANIRDRAALGHFDITQMLAPMPLAASLGITPLATPMITPVVLGLGNNAITVSADLWRAMADQGAPGDLAARPAGAALAKVVASSPRKLRFGVVHQTSSHNYELRYWLAASGIRPDRDIEIVVLPPPLLPDALMSGGIDGYCVGEPWNSIGVASASAHIATVKASIWQSSPDKVVGMRAVWAESHPDLVAAIIRAVYRAGQWCADPANHAEAAQIMSGSAYLNAPAEIVGRSLSGMLDTGGGHIQHVADYFIPHASAANFPWKSHALWYYTQMVRWGEVAASPSNAAIAAACFRPDLYRDALAPLGAATPFADYKTEGTRAAAGDIAAQNGTLTIGPDLFFDGEVFDSDALEAYLAKQTPEV
ncbi:CmpA/NrtA family ABC transporter substrate-binding protein [Devosia sp. SL43]|uniref:CmpA/NrtA family ABC transporter substrate-binding protein n=1 Tax=Devosia sp. SL43 TaxID=2806348 RepID=UPI001F2BE615|nr:CmpA/NrtA family ABC transporter substrate-binding protein [Devosia sp. SL43]UJW85473.1 ABC transporter substrate-binding protein [Devosia sp. SL43]